MLLDEFLRLVDITGKNGDSYLGRCPAHDDQKSSLSVCEADQYEGFMVKCFANCTKEEILSALHLEEKDLFYNSRKERNGLPQEPVRRFEIRSLEGHLLAVRCRIGSGPKKELWWEQPDGKKGLGGIKVAELPLYGSQLKKDWLASRWIDITEGEAAAEALLKLGANALGTSTGASSCPSEGVLKCCFDRRVRLWPDNDNPGRSHMQKIAEKLKGVAIKVITLDTSKLPPKGDAVEWIHEQLKAGLAPLKLTLSLQEEDGSGELPGLQIFDPNKAEKPETKEVKEEIRRTQPKQQKEKESLTQEASKKPLVVISGKQMSDLITEAWNAVIKGNDPPVCFRRASKLVHIVTESGSSPMVEELGEAGFRGILARCAQWFKENENGLQSCFPPRELAQDAQVFSDARLPLLKSVASSPVFAPDGSLCSIEGYHYNAQTFVTLPEKIELKTEPTKESAQAAAKFILEELIGDFAFATEADRAHALGAFLTPLCRNLIAGPTPLHDFSSPVQGSGKGLLCQTIAVVVLGKQVAGQRLPSDEEEIGKTLLSELSTARPIILLDNTDATGRKAIDSASLEGVLTAEEWTGRRLGKIGMLPPLPNRSLWCITGVNLEFAKGLMRRRVRVRIDPHSEEPWKRPASEFKRPGDQLLNYAKEKRSEILSALFSIALYYLSLSPAEKPQVKTLGSFESWSRIIGGMVTSAGVPGWLGYQDDPEESVVESGLDEWPEFIAVWLKEFADYPQTVAKLNELADRNGLLFNVRGEKGKKSEETRLGGELKKLRARIINGQRITPQPNKHSKGTYYKLLPALPRVATPQPSEALPSEDQERPGEVYEEPKIADESPF